MTSHALAAEDAAPDFYLIEDDDHAHAAGGTMLGFWIYLMSDALIFATLFATYGVLSTSYARGPAPRQIFELPTVAVNTAMLLFSSITYGMATIDMEAGRTRAVQAWLAVTALFGLAFVGIELHEFAGLIDPGRDAAAQRVPVRLLRAGRHAWPARQLRPDLDRRDAGAGQPARAVAGRTDVA